MAKKSTGTSTRTRRQVLTASSPILRRRSYSAAGADQMGREGVLVQIDYVAYVD